MTDENEIPVKAGPGQARAILTTLVKPFVDWYLAHRIGGAVAIGALMGVGLGTYAEGSEPEVIVALLLVLIAPFFLLDARYKLFGRNALDFGVWTMVGSLVGTLAGTTVNALGGAAVGVSLIAAVKWVVRKAKA